MNRDRDPARDENLRQMIIEQELPDRQRAVTGFTEHDNKLYAVLEISRSLYRCAECAGQVAIGATHILTRTMVREGPYDHHRVHEACFQEKVLPRLGNLAIIKAHEATETKINKRRRKRHRGRR